MKLQKKEYYDQTRNIVSETFKESDLVLLHDTQDETLYLTIIKMKFCWSGLYHIQEVISEKDSYFLEELNRTSKKSFIYDNRLKKFWLQDPHFNISKDDLDMRMGRVRAARKVYGPPGRVLRVKKFGPDPARQVIKIGLGHPENPVFLAEFLTAF